MLPGTPILYKNMLQIFFLVRLMVTFNFHTFIFNIRKLCTSCAIIMAFELTFMCVFFIDSNPNQISLSGAIFSLWFKASNRLK